MNHENIKQKLTLSEELADSSNDGKQSSSQERVSPPSPLRYRLLSVPFGDPRQDQHNAAQDELESWLQTQIGLSEVSAKKIGGRYASYNSYCLPGKVALLKEKNEDEGCNLKELLNCFRVACAFEEDNQQYFEFIDKLDRKELFDVISQVIPYQLSRVVREAFLTDAQDCMPSLKGLLAGLDMIVGEYVARTEQIEMLIGDSKPQVGFHI